jgi:hypothetical protein
MGLHYRWGADCCANDSYASNYKTYDLRKKLWYDGAANRGGKTVLDLAAYARGEPKPKKGEQARGALFFERWQYAYEQGWIAEPPPAKAKGRERARFDYTDEKGALLFQVVRFDTEVEKERFRQRRPDGKGGWIWDIKGVRRVLYRLPALIAAVKARQLVLICEGEKDTNTAVQLGYAATTNPGGVGKWDRDDYDECLRGADVVIVSDNDAHGKGQAHAATIAARLNKVVAQVRIVMSAVKDLTEWVGAGHTREELDALIEHAPYYGDASSVGGDLGEWDAGDEPGVIPPRQWLLGNQFCRGFISSIVAAGGAGKSALRLLQYISLAIGRSLCGQHVFRRCRVLLISLEDDRHELQRRIKAVLDHYGVDRAELKGWLFCASSKLAKLAEMKNRTRTIGPLEHQLEEAIERRKPDIRQPRPLHQDACARRK